MPSRRLLSDFSGLHRNSEVRVTPGRGRPAGGRLILMPANPPVRRIDLNADLGEDVTDDPALLALVTSANVASGFHAGGPAVMRAVCDRAADLGVIVGAQVSYADREGFGRRPMDPGSEVLSAWVAEQVATLREIARAAGTEVRYLKPHGALYNRVVDDEEQASAVLEAAGDLPVLGLPGSAFLRLAQERGSRVVPEGFPDRGYTADGRLVPRDRPGALVEDIDLIARNALELATSGVVETVCVHGDSPRAVDAARAVAVKLRGAGVELVGWARDL